ncbi:MAG: MFS transporter [Neisseriaceae bacterium]|nr:MFS transporter [Neisseriaceae bacterium]MBP6862516.1 MFS transporter [Neisseriaceae bacterium]
MPLAIYILGFTIFAVGTTELMVAGMIASLAAAFAVSVAEVGYLIAYYALGMTIGGPILTICLLRLQIPHKQAVLGLLLGYVLFLLVATFSQTYAVMALARVITGMTGAACFGVSLAIAAQMVAPEVRGRAASVVLGGLMLANVFGVPIATLIDQQWGWRMAFGCVAALVMVCMVVIVRTVPDLPAGHVSLSTEVRSLRQRPLWAAYTTSALIIGSAFATFSYIAPILTELSGFSAAAIPVLLGVYGLANVVGNALVGRYADRYALPIMLGGVLTLTLAMLGFIWGAASPIWAVAMLIVIGLVGVPMNPAMVTRVMRVATPGPLVNTLHASVINIGLAGGAFLGGLGISSGLGFSAPLWVGAALAALGFLSLLPYVRKPARGW